MSTGLIAYDRPVVDLVDELNATGHVTHTAYRKTSVTLHHNAGINTLEQVLNTWKVRPASTQFGVDKTARVGQFTKVNEYAWACGNTEGNMRSIHIEMSNSTLGPEWRVADITWKAAARLAGWLFAKVIGARPSSSNFFYHRHWFPTACAGPYMQGIYAKVLAAAQAAYDYFVRAVQPAPVHVLRRPWPLYMAAGDVFGHIDGPPGQHGGFYPNERPDVMAIQARLKMFGRPITVDGIFGDQTVAAVTWWQNQFWPSTHVSKLGKLDVNAWLRLFTY